MNDQRFTELLNLHLDHETSPAEAAELEAELNRDPARRRQYQTYSRMQHACAQLFEREHAQAPASFALEKALLDAERKVAASPPPAIRRPFVTALAGLSALAACLAFVLTRTASITDVAGKSQQSPPPVAAIAPARPATPPAMLASSAPPPATPENFQAVFLPAPNSGPARGQLGEWTQYFEQMPTLQPVTMQVLAATPNQAVSADMTIGPGRGPSVPNTQTAAFQFQR